MKHHGMIAVVALGTCVVANAQGGDTTKELVCTTQGCLLPS